MCHIPLTVCYVLSVLLLEALGQRTTECVLLRTGQEKRGRDSVQQMPLCVCM